MTYIVDRQILPDLLAPAATALEAIVRLDERVARSPVRAGWIERTHYQDAVSALWVEGELVTMEDLVLHDARMDMRAPTHAMTRAHEVLRMRRRIAAEPPGWALSAKGLDELTGRSGRAAGPRADTETGQGALAAPAYDGDVPGSAPADGSEDAFEAALSRMDAVLARSARVLASGGRATTADLGAGAAPPPSAPKQRPADVLLYDDEWDEKARLAEWLDTVSQTRGLPTVLRAAAALDAWQEIDVLQHGGLLATLLVSALLRQEQTTTAHLACLQVGARAVPREKRHARSRAERLVAWLDAIRLAALAGMREHDRLVLARAAMEQRMKGRRASSRLPALMELALSRPLVSTATIQAELRVSRQGALDLVEAFGLREVTGRGRYKAWGIV